MIKLTVDTLFTCNAGGVSYHLLYNKDIDLVSNIIRNMQIQVTLSTGSLNVFGTSPSSKVEAERRIAEDLVQHHIYFNPQNFHNHTNHHLLACLDLGASAKRLSAIAEQIGAQQRVIDVLDSAKGLKSGAINEDNWSEHLGHDANYKAYLHFFSEQVTKYGINGLVEKYLLANKVNAPPVRMRKRLMYGLLHPLIQLGYGVEFNSPPIVAQALALTCSEEQGGTFVFDSIYSDVNVLPIESLSLKSSTLLEILAKVYENPILQPLPYDASRDLFACFVQTFANPAVGPEIVRMTSLWALPSDSRKESWDAKIEEFIHLATLLTFATSKKGRGKPRLDFALMHLLTTAFFIPILFDKVITKPGDRASLLRNLLATAMLVTVVRGAPRIDCNLVMSYPDTQDWPSIVQTVLTSAEAHVSKTLRALIYAQRRYSTKLPGTVIGAYYDRSGKETHPGSGSLDGSLWVKCAGVLVDTVARTDVKEFNWDFSGLGWEEAWNR